MDHDDLTKVQFKDKIISDPDIKAENDHLLLKYYGSKITKSKPPLLKRENLSDSKSWFISFKPVLLSLIIVLISILSKWSKVVNILSFTTKDIVNQVIVHGVFFIIVVALVTLL